MTFCSGSLAMAKVKPFFWAQGSDTSGVSTLIITSVTPRASNFSMLRCSSPSCELQAGHQKPR